MIQKTLLQSKFFQLFDQLESLACETLVLDFDDLMVSVGKYPLRALLATTMVVARRALRGC